MADISPFSAIRPVRDKVHLVATRPYYSYKKNVLEAKLESNPFTFLHIINPEFGKTIQTKANSTERFELVKKGYADFLNDGILIKDESPRIYIYRQTTEERIFTGVIAGSSIEEYTTEKIKKHEETLSERETMFTNYLDVVGFNAEPVLLSYSETDEIAELLSTAVLVRPEYEFTTTDRIKHELWILSVEETLAIQKAFLAIEATYIADGHHRTASSARLYKERKQKGLKTSKCAYFLSFLVAEKSLKVLEYNRLLKDLKSHTKETFLSALQNIGTITPLNEIRKPIKEHQFTVCFERDYFSFELFAHLIDKKNSVSSIDSAILSDFILAPILGIKDLKNSDNIEFSPGNIPLKDIEEKLAAGKCALAFLLFPLTIEQVNKVADEGLNMPPKSTWLEPKLRSGLTIYSINE